MNLSQKLISYLFCFWEFSTFNDNKFDLIDFDLTTPVNQQIWLIWFLIYFIYKCIALYSSIFLHITQSPNHFISFGVQVNMFSIISTELLPGSYPTYIEGNYFGDCRKKSQQRAKIHISLVHIIYKVYIWYIIKALFISRPMLCIVGCKS